MAEALAIVSIIANVVAIVDITIEIYDTAKGFSDDVSALPKAYREARDRLPLILDTLRRTAEYAEAGKVDDQTCKALTPVLLQCNTNVKVLQDLFQQIVPAQGSSALRVSYKAASSVFHKTKVETVMKRILEDVSVLVSYHVVQGATKEQVAELAEAISRLSVAVTQAPPPVLESPTLLSLMPASASEDKLLGRDNCMKWLESKLCVIDRHCRSALIGLGGIGKTRVAIEFATNLRNSKTTSVFWVHAGSAARIEKAYADIARKAAIPGWDLPTANKLQLVKEWLEGDRCGQWLMIVDNADDIDLFYGTTPDRMATYFPKSNNGSILLTSRDRRVGLKFTGASNVLVLDALASSDSAMLLEARLGEYDTSSLDDRVRLAETLENIPLAIVQASAYISSNMITVDEYLELYIASDASKIEMLSEEFEDGVRDEDTTNPIAATWAISFKQIRDRYSRAADLLSMMSMFDSQAIPKSLLASQIDRKAFLESIATLKGFSLISERSSYDTYAQSMQTRLVNESLYYLHRLVRLAMRSWLKLSNKFDLWIARAISTTAAVYPEGKFENRDIWATYLPHALELFTTFPQRLLPDDLPAMFIEQAMQEMHAPEDSLCAKCTSQLMYNVSWSYYTRGHNDQAEIFAAKGLTIRRYTLGLDHADTVKSFHQVGANLRSLGMFALAEKHYCSALNRDVFLSEMAQSSVFSAITMGTPLEEQRSIDSPPSTVAYSDDHGLSLVKPQYSFDAIERQLANMTSLSWVYCRWGRLREAEELELQTFKMREGISGPEHTETLRSMNSLACIYLSQGRYEEGATMTTRVADRRLVVLGDMHPETLRSRAVLNTIYNATGRHKDVLRSGVMQAQTLLLGEQHPDTMRSMTDYAVAYSIHGHYAEERALVVRVRKNMLSLRGLMHPDTLVAEGNVAILWGRTGLFTRKESEEIRILGIQDKLLGSKHPNTMRTNANLAYSYSKQGRFEEQERITLEILENRKQVLGETHPDTIGSLATLAGIRLRQGDHAESERLAGQACLGFTEKFGPHHPDTLSTTALLARIYRHMGRYSEAKALQLQVVQQRLDHHADNIIESVLAYRELTTTCTEVDQNQEAARYLKLAEDLKEKEKLAGRVWLWPQWEPEDWECKLISGRGELMN